MSCKHIYKIKEKSRPKNFHLIDIFMNQSETSFDRVGVIFHQCRFCGSVKNKKVFFKKGKIQKTYGLIKSKFLFTRVFFNDNINNIKKYSEFIDEFVDKVKEEYKWK